MIFGGGKGCEVSKRVRSVRWKATSRTRLTGVGVLQMEMLLKQQMSVYSELARQVHSPLTPPPPHHPVRGRVWGLGLRISRQVVGSRASYFA